MTKGIATARAARTEPNLELRDVRALGLQNESLKRHLSARGLTPAQYREKWSLPVDYPMVAPNYSKARSELAKASGLGQSRKGKKAAKKRAP